MRSIDYDLIYYDTDSIITKRHLPERYITKTKELGKWKIEGVFKSISVIGKKTYALEHEDDKKSQYKCSGGKITKEEINNVINFGETKRKHTYEKRDKNGQLRIIHCERKVSMK
jgi:hypothetical protein